MAGVAVDAANARVAYGMSTWRRAAWNAGRQLSNCRGRSRCLADGCRRRPQRRSDRLAARDRRDGRPDSSRRPLYRLADGREGGVSPINRLADGLGDPLRDLLDRSGRRPRGQGQQPHDDRQGGTRSSARAHGCGWSRRLHPLLAAQFLRACFAGARNCGVIRLRVSAKLARRACARATTRGSGSGSWRRRGWRAGRRGRRAGWRRPSRRG